MNAIHRSLKSLEKTGIKRTPLLKSSLTPKLATLAVDIPQEKNWIFEEKLDGYRIFGKKNNKTLSLLTRNDKDWTGRFKEIARLLQKIPASSFILDGEIIAPNAQGKSSFTSLQEKLSAEDEAGFVYYIFDILYLEGYDLRPLPLFTRKKLLSELLRSVAASALVEMPYEIGKGTQLFKKAARQGREGIVAKDGTSPYSGGRDERWLKIKCHREDEFVIGGWTDPKGSREHFGALLVGYFERGRFIYAGKVGTGFDHKGLGQLLKLMQKQELTRPAFATPLLSREKHGAHFVEPRLVGQFAYSEWTRDRRLRHPVFLGLREDKPAREVTFPEKFKQKEGV